MTMNLQLFGIDYLVCDECGKAFPACAEDYRGCSCGKTFCEDCVEDAKFAKNKNGGIKENKWGEPVSCKYCRGEEITDDALLEKALKLLKMSREDLIKAKEEDK